MTLEMSPHYVINQIDLVIQRNKLLFPMASYDETEKLNNNIEALKMAKQAVEKLIPKKVIFMSDKSKVCGSCKQRVLKHQPYCEDCGQALDWSEDAE